MNKFRRQIHIENGDHEFLNRLKSVLVTAPVISHVNNTKGIEELKEFRQMHLKIIREHLVCFKDALLHLYREIHRVESRNV